MTFVFTGRRRRGGVMSGLVVLVAAGLLAAVASAAVTSDLNNWNLSPSVSAYGGGTQFHFSQNGPAQFRWLDSPNHPTVISSNDCPDGASIGTPQSIPAGNTDYHTTGSGAVGGCFIMKGRTDDGGSMVNHDGRVSR